MRVALTIAGSDGSGGAGIQADLKTFAAHGVYAVTAITSVTAQNTVGIHGTTDLPPAFVRAQIEALAGDMTIAAIKTGMLANAAVVATVAETIGRLRLQPLVVDPVLTSSSGRSLLTPDALDALKTLLLPLAGVVTPNSMEAGRLAGFAVTSVEDARRAAITIHALGPRAVIVKGGHLEGADAIDILFDGRDFVELSACRIPAAGLHGAGCTFASAIAAGLAMGDTVTVAAEKAKRYTTGAIAHGLRPGHGRAVLDHFWNRAIYS